MDTSTNPSSMGGEHEVRFRHSLRLAGLILFLVRIGVSIGSLLKMGEKDKQGQRGGPCGGTDRTSAKTQRPAFLILHQRSPLRPPHCIRQDGLNGALAAVPSSTLSSPVKTPCSSLTVALEPFAQLLRNTGGWPLPTRRSIPGDRRGAFRFEEGVAHGGGDIDWDARAGKVCAGLAVLAHQITDKGPGGLGVLAALL